jgi:[protein-PII] uridylyltransferase
VDPARLRAERAQLLDDESLQGRAFGRALASVLDSVLTTLATRFGETANVALVALGSYGRGELCPGSDVDVLLLHTGRGRRGVGDVRALAEQVWYPLWDAGFVTGHGARTVRESISLADDDLDALTTLLEARHVVGNEALTAELVERGRQLARKRQARVLKRLAEDSELRRLRPGPVAEMLEPDLKEGAGGLRDVQSLEWAGWTFGAPGGGAALVERGYLSPDDRARLFSGRERLLEARVALQRVTGSRADRLALQEQDAVAASLGLDSAGTLVRDLASAAREVAWIARDVWMRVRDSLGGPSGRVAQRDQTLAEHVVLRDRRVHVSADVDGTVPPLRALDAAAAAAELDAPFDRPSLVRLAEMRAPTWDVWERAAFLRLLRAGAPAVTVFEALDHEGVLTRVLPEWEHVRSRPQRNAYHRFTVDRHLLEAVAECARLLDEGDSRDGSFDGVVARACRRPELLLLGALLHDLGKGMPGDHSVAGAEAAARVVRRIGLDSEGREIVVWLVRNHLLMADVATRRDLSDASVADNVAARCAGDAERLRLLYLLTIGDSRATGPAAWSPAKAALLRDLFVKAAAAVERGAAKAVADDRRAALIERVGVEPATALLDRLPEAYVLAFDDATIEFHASLLAAQLASGGPAVTCERGDSQVTITVVAPDRPGLLATLAGALTLCGLDVLEANVFGTIDGIALDVFRAADPFGRVADGGARVESTIQDALAGKIDLAERVAERSRAYRRPGAKPGPIEIDVDADESETDTVVEVHADDEIGLLYRLAAGLAAVQLDVRLAKVATLGSRVVDVFYVRDTTGRKIADPDALEQLRDAMTAHLHAD